MSEEAPLCKDCWCRHWYSDECPPEGMSMTKEALKKRKQRSSKKGRKDYNDYMKENWRRWLK